MIVHELEPHDAVEALRDGSCDLAITFTYNLIAGDPPPGVSRQVLSVEPILIALPADHRAATGEVDLRVLREEQWIAGSRGTTDHEMRHRTSRYPA
ncbi:hypothetical protein Pth03_56710 [Planotetraspora thailandica]|uniref:LysR substrate-binding domain-containing protein n=1 Tax=Planotetraspora thailandica TaxID=487172 RepID=A0A8J3V8A0_9ACTN|nr:LysR substrate-binding domain-containing protein [Planotetraspora thailandica]GII57282.1 hypothetical protein Pth03_56710 [Planotetraspora thailandica]